MDWKEFQENARALTELAAQKINATSELASLHLQLKALESRRRSAYEALGKTAYLHFTTDDSGAEAIAKHVEGITLLNREIADLHKVIEKVKNTPPTK